MKVISAGIEGILTPTLKEYPFNRSVFSNEYGQYYDAYDFITSTEPEAHNLDPSKQPSSSEMLANGMQTGGLTSGGIFCEKPVFARNSESSLYFPLGSGGSGEHIASGYKLNEFATGGTAKELNITNKDKLFDWAIDQVGRSALSQETTFTLTYNEGWYYQSTLIENLPETLGITVIGYLTSSSHIIFTLKIVTTLSGSERNVVKRITHEGSITPVTSVEIPLNVTEEEDTGIEFPTSTYNKKYFGDYRGLISTGPIINNLLKFRTTQEETEEVTVDTAELFSYAVPSFETIKNLTVRTATRTLVKDVDYLLFEEGIFRSLINLEVGSKLYFTYVRHNYWSPSWKRNPNTDVQHLSHNFLLALDGAVLSHRNTVSGVYDVTPVFTESVEIQEDGWYNLSGYFKLESDTAETTSVYRFYLANSANDLTDASTNHFCYTDYNVPVNDTGSNREFTVGKTWTRISQAMYMQRGTYAVAITWDPNKVNLRDKLQVLGLCLVPGKQAPLYDYRKIAYTNLTFYDTSLHPLLFKFTGNTSNTDNWVLTYIRYIFNTSATGMEVLDSIGNLQLGYDSNGVKVYLNGESLDVTVTPFSPSTEIVVDELNCNYERVYIRKQEQLLKIMVLNYITSYSIEIQLSNNFELNQTTDGINWNVALGCDLETYYPVHYRGLWWFPLSDMTTEELARLGLDDTVFLYQRFGTVVDTHINRQGNPEEDIMVKGEFLKEVN